MASSIEFVEYILEQIPIVTYRKIFGEYWLYYQNKVVALIYDDRLLVKVTKNSEEILKDNVKEAPYKGAKDMYLI